MVGCAAAQARNDPDHKADLEMGEEDVAPPPEPLAFAFEEPELLDADMLEMLAYPESKARALNPDTISRSGCACN